MCRMINRGVSCDSVSLSVVTIFPNLRLSRYNWFDQSTVSKWENEQTGFTLLASFWFCFNSYFNVVLNHFTAFLWVFRENFDSIQGARNKVHRRTRCPHLLGCTEFLPWKILGCSLIVVIKGIFLTITSQQCSRIFDFFSAVRHSCSHKSNISRATIARAGFAATNLGVWSGSFVSRPW